MTSATTATPRRSLPAAASPGRLTYLSIMLTRRCNMTCSHCSVESGPRVTGEPSEDELVEWIRQAAAAGIRVVRLTGGEPMLREALVHRLLEECRRLHVATGLTTNGFWGRTRRDATRRVKALTRAGLRSLTLSVDRFHAEFHAGQSVRHIAEAAEAAGLQTSVNLVRGPDDAEIEALAAPFVGFEHVHLRFYDLQAVGRAREFEDEQFASYDEGFCAACESPALTDDGRVIACNGPSYFSPAHSPLAVGSLSDTPMAELVRRHAEDPVLETIRTTGPAGLRQTLRAIPGFEAFPFRTRYRGVCDLCQHITSNQAAVEALRTELDAPVLRAKRTALHQIIYASHEDGVLSWAYVNGAGFARAIMQLVRDHRADRETDRLLRRADIDWAWRVRYLVACGLARPALAALDPADGHRYAPSLVVNELRRAAVQEGVRGLVQRDALDRLDAVLADAGVEGVLLKGAALPALAGGHPSPFSARAAGDLDVYVPPEAAQTVRALLLAHGFGGRPNAPRTAAHHLAPVRFAGAAVEIHTRLMPAFWGLPESDLLAHRRRAPDRRGLATLDPEGYLLHACVHAAAHMFALGLKVGWDVSYLADQQPPLDGDRLARWIQATRLPRAFWVPCAVLTHELRLPIPPSLLRDAPTDRRERDLELLARRLLFLSSDSVWDLNPLSRNALMLLLHDSWLGRGRYLTDLFGPLAREARQEARRRAPAQAWRALPGHVRQAWRQWGQYRRAVRIADRLS